MTPPLNTSIFQSITHTWAPHTQFSELIKLIVVKKWVYNLQIGIQMQNCDWFKLEIMKEFFAAFTSSK